MQKIRAKFALRFLKKSSLDGCEIRAYGVKTSSDEKATELGKRTVGHGNLITFSFNYTGNERWSMLKVLCHEMNIF
jgi:hypothetical protein